MDCTVKYTPKTTHKCIFIPQRIVTNYKRRSEATEGPTKVCVAFKGMCESTLPSQLRICQCTCRIQCVVLSTISIVPLSAYDNTTAPILTQKYAKAGRYCTCTNVVYYLSMAF